MQFFFILGVVVGSFAQCPVEVLALDLQETNGELKQFLDADPNNAQVWNEFFKSNAAGSLRRDKALLEMFSSDFTDDAEKLAMFELQPELIKSWKFVFDGTGIRTKITVL